MIIGRLVLIYRKAGLTGIPYDDKPVGHTGNGRIGGNAVYPAIGIIRHESNRFATVYDLYGIGLDERRQLIDDEFCPFDINQLVISGRTTGKDNRIFARIRLDRSRCPYLRQFVKYRSIVVSHKAFVTDLEQGIFFAIKAYRIGNRDRKASLFHHQSDRIGHGAVVPATFLCYLDPCRSGRPDIDFPIGNDSDRRVGYSI